MRNLRIAGFRGMNNVINQKTLFVDEEGFTLPRVILNADAYDDRVLLKKTGYRQISNLPNVHSFCGASVLLCVSQGGLYRVEDNIKVCDIPDAPTSYVEVGGKIYLSNPYWTGIYDISKKEVVQWGIPLPPVPQIQLIEGNLPQGTYHVCYTYIGDNGLIGGNGEIRKVEFYGQSKGIQIINRPENTLCWITDTNTKIFYLADSDNITEPYRNIPLLSFSVIPPQPMSRIIHAFSRIWGIRDNRIDYSEPFVYEWFKENNNFEFEDELIMLASTRNSLYCGSLKSTWVLSGISPEKMTVLRVGEGVIRGSQGYGIFRFDDTELTLPYWLDKNGNFVVGNENNVLLNVTKGKLKLSVGLSSASVFRMVNNKPQIIMTLKKGTLTEEEAFVFRSGRIFVPDTLAIKAGGTLNIEQLEGGI